MIDSRWTFLTLLYCVGVASVPGCSSNGDATEHPEQPSTAAVTTEVHVPNPASATAPTSTAAAVTSSSATAPASGAPVTCLMWRVCGCNHGCSGIRVPTSDLKEGMKVTIVSGEERGREVFVEKAPQAGGGETLVLTRDDPSMPRGCEVHRPSPLFAYGCESSKSGPVPQNACAAGCGSP